jgi:ParB-like chromosome segregation protein Spo0J
VQTQRVPIALIKIPQVRVTMVHSQEVQELLRGTIAKLGNLTPVILTKTGDDYTLVDGLHRIQELQATGATEVDAVIYEGGPEENYLLNLTLNQVRGKARASEMVSVIEQLTKVYSLDSEEISKRTGLTREYIEKLWKITEASVSVREALDQELIGVGAAWEISRLPSHEQQDYLVSMQGIWKMPAKDLHNYVNDIIKMMSSPTPAAPQVQLPLPTLPKCDGCRKETEMKYLKPIVICPNCYGVVYKAIKEAQAPADGDPEAPPY